MRSYEAARGWFSLLELLSWCIIVGGVLFALALGNEAQTLARAYRQDAGTAAFLAAIPGLIVGFCGFLFLVGVQVGRATVDCAEYAQQTLKVTREQLEISKQALKQGEQVKQGFAALSAQREQPSVQAAGYAAAPTTVLDAQSEATESQPLFAAVSTTEPIIDGDTLTYKGRTASLIQDKWVMNGITFGSPDKLIQYVDQYGIQQSASKTLRAER